MTEQRCDVIAVSRATWLVRIHAADGPRDEGEAIVRYLAAHYPEVEA